MRIIPVLLAVLLSICTLHAQKIEYKTFIYTSDELADELASANASAGDSRGLGDDLLNSSIMAAKGIGGGYITSVFDLGVNALGSLITRNSRLQNEWEQMVKAENKWSTHISSINDVRDFYSEPSTAGALDPLNMVFDGIGCLRTEGTDTVFFISCHIDRSKLDRIINHSKFELVLDTLILSPFHSNLPNTQLPIDFSFDERKNFSIGMDIRLTSSWFTDAIELHNNEILGEFKISIPVTKEELDEKGYLRYVRKPDETPKYSIIGESFIVPRSYMGYRDPNGKYRNIWGTGQYKLDINLAETCDITPEYRAAWKADRKKRKKMTPSKGFFSTVWQTISSQNWDEITRAWVITTVTAPADIIESEIKDAIGVPAPKTAQNAAGSQGKAAQMPQGVAKPK